MCPESILTRLKALSYSALSPVSSPSSATYSTKCVKTVNDNICKKSILLKRSLLNNSYLCNYKDFWIMNKEQKDKLTYIISCIAAFGEYFSLSSKQAYSYLKRFGGLAFLEECYAAEHTLSLFDAVNDMSVVCQRNGGGLL